MFYLGIILDLPKSYYRDSKESSPLPLPSPPYINILYVYGTFAKTKNINIYTLLLTKLQNLSGFLPLTSFPVPGFHLGTTVRLDVI